MAGSDAVFLFYWLFLILALVQGPVPRHGRRFTIGWCVAFYWAVVIFVGFFVATRPAHSRVVSFAFVSSRFFVSTDSKADVQTEHILGTVLLDGCNIGLWFGLRNSRERGSGNEFSCSVTCWTLSIGRRSIWNRAQPQSGVPWHGIRLPINWSKSLFPYLISSISSAAHTPDSMSSSIRSSIINLTSDSPGVPGAPRTNLTSRCSLFL